MNIAMDWLYFLFLMLAFAVIPGVPAVILRVFAPRDTSYRLLATIGTMLGLICLAIIILSGQDTLTENENLSTFAQCALTSTVPVLFCVAFIGAGKQVWIAVVPAVTYFLGNFVRHFAAVGFLTMISDALFNPYMLYVILLSGIFFIWAVICIFITKMIYKSAQWIIKKKAENKRKQNPWR